MAVIEAGTGTGKSLGYLIPAALAARSGGLPVAVSTFTQALAGATDRARIALRAATGARSDRGAVAGKGELPFAFPPHRGARGRGSTPADSPRNGPGCLAALVRFAEASPHGNLEELGYPPKSLDDFLQASGGVLQVLASMRSSPDDPAGDGPDFYRRAQDNAGRADLVVVNHALLLNRFLHGGEEPFTQRIVCDEAHTLEEAATLALEGRVEEQALRRQLRAVHDPTRRAGLTVALRRGLGWAGNDERLTALARAADDASASLDGLAEQARKFVRHQTVVNEEELARYGVRADHRTSRSRAGGPALRGVATTFHDRLRALIDAIAAAVGRGDGNNWLPRPNRAGVPGRCGLARSLLRDLREAEQRSGLVLVVCRGGSDGVRVVELGPGCEERDRKPRSRSSGCRSTWDRPCGGASGPRSMPWSALPPP